MSDGDKNSEEFSRHLEILEKSIALEADIKPETLWQHIEDCLESLPRAQRKALGEALFVRLANQREISGHGAPLEPDDGTSAGGGRARFYLHPFPMAKAGAAMAVGCRDADGRIFVLLGAKRKEKTMRLLIPGGYMDAGSLEGEPDYVHDADLEATARRELKEETGMQVPEEADVSLVWHRSRHGVTDHPDAHTLGATYLYDMGVVDRLPTVAPDDDIAFLAWVPLDAMRFDPQPGVQAFGADTSRFAAKIDGKWHYIVDGFGETLELVGRMLRDNELKMHGYDRKAAYGFLKARASEKRARELTQAQKASELGVEAAQRHRRDLRLARFLEADLKKRFAPHNGGGPRL